MHASTSQDEPVFHCQLQYSLQKLITSVTNEALFCTYQLGALLASKRSGIMGLIPLSERQAVNKDDTVLDQSLGSDQLIVGGIVDHINDPGLPCAAWVHQTLANQKSNQSSFKSIKCNRLHTRSFSESLLSPLSFSSRTGQSYHHRM